MTSEGILLSSNEQKNHISDQEIHDILAILDDSIQNKSLDQNMHLEKLDKILQKCGPANISKFMQKCSNPEVKLLVLKRLRALAIIGVKDTSINVIDMFNTEEVGLNEEYVVDILSDAFGNLPTDILKKLLLDIIIPEMFNTNNFSKKVHDMLIDVGYQLIEKFHITNLNNQEIKLFTTKVIEKYSKILESLREQNYSRWHDLWIFFVRFSAKHLHVSMDLANKLLRVVEFAFRNPSYEQRLKGYDCWKELIDNASLDVKHLCSNKQIKLLVTPLRAKFSKMEIVICKRFEIFLYLLEKLQRQSVLCLNEFLEFCFGVSNNANCSKNGQGKLVPNLWLKSIQVFLAILGDQTHICVALNRTLFEEPVIDANNFNKFGNVAVCAVIECSIILKQIPIESQEKISILTSLWESLFDIIVKTTTELQEKCFQTIFDSLSTIFKVYNEDVTYIGLYAAFGHLLESSIDQRLISDSLKLLLEYSLQFLGESDVSHEFSQEFCELIQISCKENHMIDFLLEQLKKLEASRNESKLYTIWNIVGTKLILDSNITYDSKMIIHCFLWPVYHLQSLSEQTSIDTCSTWQRLFVKASQLCDTFQTTVLNEYEKCLKSNPLLSANIATLIAVLAHLKLDFTKEFVSKLLELILTIMSMPLLPIETSEKMHDLVLKCANTVAKFSADEIDTEIVNNLSRCIDRIRSHQKNPQLVEVLENVMSKKIIRSSPLSIEKRRKSLASPQDSTGGNIKRSLRMTQMVCEKESGKSDNKDRVNALKLFGKDIDTLTPLKVKGSMLQDHKITAPNSRSRKIINSVKKPLVPEPPSVEDHSSDYVLITSEVKLQKDKLTEHQIEELKRRREDIPALYQDLSQSQTQTLSLTGKEVTSSPAEANCKVSLENDPCAEYLNNECNAVKCSDEEISVQKDSEENNTSAMEYEKASGSPVRVSKDGNRDSLGKVRNELRKIRMNIVGGDTFLENLPSKRPRKFITSVLTKKTKKAEEESKVQGGELHKQVSDKERLETICDTSSREEAQLEKIAVTSKKLVVNIANVLDCSQEKTLDEPKDSTPGGVEGSNNRKNKFIKPKKLIVTPKSDKKKTRSDKIGTPTKKVKLTKLKTKKIEFDELKESLEKSSNNMTIPEHIQSEIMFESEVNNGKKKQTGKTGIVKRLKNKNEAPGSSSNNARQIDDTNKAGNNISIQIGESDEKRNNIGKYKKLPKEIMKKNKEKVRKIQRQLKLASLSDLADSSGSKKTKGDKLLFIREITKSKHVENTKLAPVGLKRNKDKKSSSVAYSIEPPETSVDLSSLNLGIMQSTLRKSEEKVLTVTKSEKPTKKRKRSSSLGSNSGLSPDSESSSIENKQNLHKKIKLKKKSIHEKGVPSQSNIKSTDLQKQQELASDNSKSSPWKIKTKCLIKQECPGSSESVVKMKRKISEDKIVSSNLNIQSIDLQAVQELDTYSEKSLLKIKPKCLIHQESPESNMVEVKLKRKSFEEKSVSSDTGIKPSDSQTQELVSSSKKSQLKTKTKCLINSELPEVIVEELTLNRNSTEDKSISSNTVNKSSDLKKEQDLNTENKTPSPLKIERLINQESPERNVVEAAKKITKKNSPHKKPTVLSPSLDSPSRITRSRASSLSPMDHSSLSASKQKNNLNNEPTRAVAKLLFQESEDIIESSQDSLLETTTGNTSKCRNKTRSPKPHIQLKETLEVEVVCVNEGRAVSGEVAVEEVAAEVKTLNVEGDKAHVEEKTSSGTISQADTLSCESNVEPQPIAIDIDLPERPELTESEKILSTTDTVSIVSQSSEVAEVGIGNISGLNVEENGETLRDVVKIDTVEESSKSKEEGTSERSLEVGTPARAQRSGELPGSPVSKVTPTLTRELLDNTMDISPISTQLASEEVKNRANEIEANLDEVLGRTIGAKLEPRPANDSKPGDKVQLSLNLRSDRLLNMVNVASPVSRRKTVRKISSSPATVNSRYEKLFSFVNGSKEDEARADKKKNDPENCTEKIEDVLTFTREVPSPYALPGSSILKRKLTDVDEGFSPCPKRKRVNFSYPCISSTKLYIRHKEELNTYCPPSIAQKLFGDDYEDEDNGDEDPFANPIPESNETEESMDITNTLMLCRKKPIYEQLVACTENVDRLWKRLSSPTYSELLHKLLASKQIHTIGDLASLSEVQINRLPFKQPRIKTVRKALNFYFTNVYKKTIEVAEPCTTAESESDTKTDAAIVISANASEETSQANGKVPSEEDLREEFFSVMTKIKKQKMPLEEFGATFLDLVDESEVIDVLKSVYNTDFRQFFEKCHWRYLIETIVHSGGTNEMFDIISDLAENNETFAGQLESIVQLRMSQNPLKDILVQRSLTEIAAALEDCINRDAYKREEVVQKCLVPLIKSPSDIKCYFNNLTIVQVNELFVQRVQPSDLSLFLEQIREHYGNYTIAQCANKSDVLKLCSKDELMMSLVEKKNEVESAIELISKISDQNKLVSIYDYISTLIPPDARREKFIEFLNTIPLSSNIFESRMH